MNIDLTDKVIAVTGAAGGIGAGISRELAASGASVALLDLDQTKARDTAATIGSAAFAVAVDVTDDASVSAALGEVADRWGRFDGLVNNAGTIVLKSADKITSAEAVRELNVNTVGTFLASKAACALFDRFGNGGRIVNVASNAGKVGYPNMAVYNASKAAVISLTRTLSLEWADRNINVNAVCPGGVATDMLGAVAEFLIAGTDKSREDMLAEMVPHQLGRHIETQEVGRVIAFLLSEHAEIIRGQSITVDGGDTPF